MPSLKQPILALALILPAAGCSNFDLARFAPPGIVKYEDLAGDQPPNPEIQERIEERKTDSDAKFPILSQTPGEDDRPEKLPTEEREARAEALVAERDALQSSVDADRTAADAAKAEADRLPQQRDALKEEADKDAEAAAQIRADFEKSQQDRN